MNLSKTIFILGLFFLNGHVGAESRNNQTVLVSDLAKKQSMGFAESDVVYELLSQSSSDQSADVNAVRGIANTVRIGYMGVEAEGRTSNFTYDTISGSGDIYRTSVSELFTDISLDLPDGATFNFVRIWGRDSNATEDMTFFLFERCLPGFSSGSITQTTLASIDSNTSAGNFSAIINISNDSITIDNNACTYTLRTRFDVADSSLRLYKVRAELQTL